MDNYLNMTVLAERRILHFVALATSRNKTVRLSNLMRAYGVYSLWDVATSGHQRLEDARYLSGLIPSDEVSCLLLEYELALKIAGVGREAVLAA